MPRLSTTMIVDCQGMEGQGQRDTGERDKVTKDLGTMAGSDAEVGQERQVVGGEEGVAVSPEARGNELQWGLVVAVVEAQDRQQAGKGARKTAAVLRVERLKARAHEASSQAVGPLVEIAEDEARPEEAGLVEDFGIEELASLEAPLHVAGAEMDVEDMNEEAGGDFDLGLEHAARFASFPRPRHVVVAR